MSTALEADTKGKRLAYRDMHTLYEAEQRRVDQLSLSEALEEIRRKEHSMWLRKELKRRLDPKDRDAIEV